MNEILPNSLRNGPDSRGRFVAETLMPNILEVEQAYEDARRDPALRPSGAACCATTSAAPARSGSPSA